MLGRRKLLSERQMDGLTDGPTENRMPISYLAKAGATT